MSNNEIEAAQQYMLELLYSQASDHLSSDYFQQQHDMTEATDSDENVPQLLESPEAADGDEGAMNPEMPVVPKVVMAAPFFPRIRGHRDGVLLPGCCCRVPTTLRHLKEEAYTPKVVSIGPFHHGNERLQEMEGHKQIMFERFTERASLSRDDLVCFVELHLVSEVRAAYPKTIDLTNTPKLVDMILLDAGFIIEFFMSCKVNDGNNDILLQPWLQNDDILLQPWLQYSIIYDLLLLENQLPFFVIEELFKIAFPQIGSRTSLLELMNVCFGYVSEQLQLDPNNLDVNTKHFIHFTDLLRLFYLQGSMQGSMPKRQPTPMDGSHILSYTASALQEAGVKLRENHKSKYLLDFKFSERILEIPQIVVHDYTELLFRNMIALEQCHYPFDAYITDYVFLLDWLIDSDRDVDLLIHNKIVKNYLGDSKAVASLINGLSVNVVESTLNPDFVKICKSLNDYCEDSWHKLEATLKHDYCRTPWQTVASIAGIVLLVLTAVGTVFTILQVVK